MSARRRGLPSTIKTVLGETNAVYLDMLTKDVLECLVGSLLEINCDFPNASQDTKSLKALLHRNKHLCVVAAFFSRNIRVHTRHGATVQQRPNDVELFKDNGQPLKVLSAANTIIRITSPMVGDRGLRCVSSEPFENESIGGNHQQRRAGDHL